MSVFSLFFCFSAELNVGGDSVDKFQIFEMWLLEHGTKFPKLELKVNYYSDSGVVGVFVYYRVLSCSIMCYLLSIIDLRYLLCDVTAGERYQDPRSRN